MSDLLKNRIQEYKNKIKNFWNERYRRHIWKTVHQAETEQSNIDLGERDMDLFLFPTKEKCEYLHAAIPLDHKIIPTFSLDFWEHHKPVTDYLPPLNKCTALDFGCGSMARYSTALARRFKHVVAVDAAPMAIEYCKRYTDKYDNIEVVEIDGATLKEVADESVHFAFSNLVFQHVGNKEVIIGLIEEISRVLKPGGLARLAFWTEEKADSHAHVYNGTGFQPDKYREIFEKAGFRVEGMSHEYPQIWITGVKNEK